MSRTRQGVELFYIRLAKHAETERESEGLPVII